MIAFDTNIAIYIANSNQQFLKQSVKILERGEALGCRLSVIMISEVLRFPMPYEHARIHELENFLKTFRNTSFIDYSEPIALQAAKLLQEHRSLRLADAIHLATAVEAGAAEFWTNDTKLEKIQLENCKIRLINEINKV